MMTRFHSLLASCVLAASACLGAQPAQTFWPKLTGSFTGASWTVADFDGDGRPDVITSSSLGYTGAGLRQIVELHSNAGVSANSSFEVVGANAGLSLIARDVDGDHDLDLVITSSISHRPVGVWINDGKGVFTAGDPSALPSDAWFPIVASLVTSRPPSDHALFFTHEQRSRAALLPTSPCVFAPKPGCGQRPRSESSASTGLDGSRRGRGPPSALASF